VALPSESVQFFGKKKKEKKRNELFIGGVA